MQRYLLWTAVAVAIGRCSHDAGYRQGLDDGWWRCVVDMGAVS